jgi:hypothetical protein
MTDKQTISGAKEVALEIITLFNKYGNEIMMANPFHRHHT